MTPAVQTVYRGQPADELRRSFSGESDEDRSSAASPNTIASALATGVWRLHRSRTTGRQHLRVLEHYRLKSPLNPRWRPRTRGLRGFDGERRQPAGIHRHDAPLYAGFPIRAVSGTRSSIHAVAMDRGPARRVGPFQLARLRLPPRRCPCATVRSNWSTTWSSQPDVESDQPSRHLGELRKVRRFPFEHPAAPAAARGDVSRGARRKLKALCSKTIAGVELMMNSPDAMTADATGARFSAPRRPRLPRRADVEVLCVRERHTAPDAARTWDEFLAKADFETVDSALGIVTELGYDGRGWILRSARRNASRSIRPSPPYPSASLCGARRISARRANGDAVADRAPSCARIVVAPCAEAGR